MQQFRVIGPAFALCFLLGGCVSYQVASDYDPGADFAGYRSFAFMPERTLIVSTNEQVSPLLVTHLKSAAVDAFEAKGFFQLADPEQADFVIAFTLGTRENVRVTSYPTAYRGAWGWGGPYQAQEIDVRNYTQGTLAIDVFDVSRRQPVWHGRAQKNITESDRGNRGLINEMVAAILEEFPPN